MSRFQITAEEFVDRLLSGHSDFRPEYTKRVVGEVTLDHEIIPSKVFLGKLQFDDSVVFTRPVFKDSFIFDESELSKDFVSRNGIFQNGLYFGKSTIATGVYLGESRFEGGDNMRASLDFGEATINGSTIMAKASISDLLSFGSAQIASLYCDQISLMMDADVRFRRPKIGHLYPKDRPDVAWLLQQFAKSTHWGLKHVPQHFREMVDAE